jgi:hypothetical protein
MRVKYVREKLPGDIFQGNVNSLMAEVQKVFHNQQVAITEPIAKIVGWDERLSERERRVRDIETNLRGQAEQLNFVGLSQAFSQQISGKVRENRAHVTLLIFSGLALLALPFVPLIAGSHVGLSGVWNIESLPKLAPFAVSELVMLYIFRVFLRNYMSVKAQLVQLELRKSLCAFVQNYAEFVGPLRKQGDPKTLEKFETLVFSGISPDPRNVPSQFDGLEAVVNTVKGINKPL